MCLMDQIPSECQALTVSNTRLGLTAAAFKLTCNGVLRRFLRRQRLCPICDQFIFESSFVEFAESSQVSRLLDRRTVITVGITSSDSSSPLPDTLLLGSYKLKELLQRHPAAWRQSPPAGMRLNKLLALESVKLSVVSVEWQQLRVEVLNGPVYHLQLLAPEGLERLVFSMWVELVRRLCDGTPEGQKKAARPLEDTGPAQDNVILESKFAEVNEDGQTSSIYAGLAVVSVTIVSSETLPDLMFLGRPLQETERETGGWPEPRCASLHGRELTRCLPLKDLKLSVHSEERQLLKVELYTGLVHYLRLLAPPGRDEAVFEQWVQLVNRLKETTTGEEGETAEGVVTLAESPPEHKLDIETLHAFCDNVVFESDFREVSEDGQELSTGAAGASPLTILISSTNPFLPLPDLMLVGTAQGDSGQSGPPEEHGCRCHLQLTKRLSLSDVTLTVHSEGQQLLRMELTPQQVHYMKLLAPAKLEKVIFEQWVQLVKNLKGGNARAEKEQREEEGSLMERPPGYAVEMDTLHAFCQNALIESNFAEVTEDGCARHLDAGVPQVRVLITSSSPLRRMPDLMLVGVPKAGQEGDRHPKEAPHETAKLTRCLPLSEVQLSVRSVERRLLRVELRNGPVYHLRLLAAPELETSLFHHWVQVVRKLSHNRKQTGDGTWRLHAGH
ncbi:uncharacterized protein LOC120517924 [Polypterus senegalus]